MVTAPGFEPILRIPFGLLAQQKPRIGRGLASTLAGYAALFLGALVTAWILVLIEPGASGELSDRAWVRYWSKVTGSSILVALLASAAGMAIIAAQRSVLSAGVMIALGLIPGMAICGMGVALGDFGLAGQGLWRWAVDTFCVIVATLAVLYLKRAVLHRRRSLG